MSNLPKIGDKVECISKNERNTGLTIGNVYSVCSCRWDDGDLLIGLVDDDNDGVYPYLSTKFKIKPTTKTKTPRKSALEKERDQLEARLALVNEGIKLESEIKTGTKELKVKKARLAEIKTKGAD